MIHLSVRGKDAPASASYLMTGVVGEMKPVQPRLQLKPAVDLFTQAKEKTFSNKAYRAGQRKINVGMVKLEFGNSLEDGDSRKLQDPLMISLKLFD